MENVETVWFTVINPHAGSGRTLHEWHRADGLLKEKGVDFIVNMTDCKYHATEMTYEAAKKGYRRFMSVGGDGTLHETLDGIMQFLSESDSLGCHIPLSDFTLSVIPIGSGNDWIRSHGIPKNLETVISLIAGESFALQDIVRVSRMGLGEGAAPVKPSYMVNVGGIGLDARVCERVNRKKDQGRSGKLLYIEALIYNILHYEASDFVVECDSEKVFEGKMYSLALGIGKYSGGGMRQTPEAVTDDGLLDVTVIPRFGLLRIAIEAFKLFNGKFLSIKELVARKA
ncbi:MAG: diacylglycerol/lipid kinase family protein, partial [Candidatus Cryptobacteroides sp.]